MDEISAKFPGLWIQKDLKVSTHISPECSNYILYISSNTFMFENATKRLRQVMQGRKDCLRYFKFFSKHAIKATKQDVRYFCSNTIKCDYIWKCDYLLPRNNIPYKFYHTFAKLE